MLLLKSVLGNSTHALGIKKAALSSRTALSGGNKYVCRCLCLFIVVHPVQLITTGIRVSNLFEYSV